MYFDVNGKKVFATTGGESFDDTRPVVIFLHGSGLAPLFWDSQSRFLAHRGYAVLVPALPGHAYSEGPTLTSIESTADWLKDIVESLDAKNVSIVAHSQGCLTSIEFACRYPDRLRSISLIASGLATPVNPALLEAAENDLDAAIAMMVNWSFGPTGQVRQGANSEDSIVASTRELMHQNTPDCLAADLHACNTYANGKYAAQSIACPTQVFVGGKDRMAPERASAELIEHLSNPEVMRFPECGHMIPIEAPDKCQSLLENFISSNNPTT
jgi:pimeloyl-ACP methyl ester carboxylesterase